MSADRFQIKRGTTSAVNAYLPSLGEPVLDTTLKQLRIGDGTTLGGIVVGVPTSTYMATVLNDVDAPTARTTLGAQTQATNLDTVSALASVANLSTLANLSSVTNLTYLNTITPVANGVPYGLTASTWGSFSITSQGRTLVGTSSQATARTTIGAAALGANTDITSLGGLTTALSVTQGGTGGNTALLAGSSLGASAVGTNTTQLAQTAMIQSEIANKRTWTSYTPTVTATTNTFTTVTVTGKYMVSFGVCDFQVQITVTTKGTGTYPVFTLPFPALTGSTGMPVALAREGAVNFKTGSGYIIAGLASCRLADSSNVDFLTADGCIISVVGRYPIA